MIFCLLFSYGDRQEVGVESCEGTVPDIGDGGEQSEVKGDSRDEEDKRKYGREDATNGRENTHIGDRVRG